MTKDTGWLWTTLVFNCYLCHVRFLLACYVRSTKTDGISDTSKRFEDFVFRHMDFLQDFTLQN